MFITASHAERIRDEMRNDPMQEGEIRRVKGLGNLFVAISSTSVEAQEYTRIYTLFIDDVEYSFYTQTNLTAEEKVS
jgi:hypothetical protein